MFKFLKKFIDKLKDPVYSCDLYKEIGCSHVDGILCDYPKCSMLKEYKDKK